MNPLKKLLSHPYIKSVGVAVSLYPKGTSRDVARSSLAQRKGKELRREEIERMRPDLEELRDICDEILKYE